MKLLSVVIPSRGQPQQVEFLQRSIKSIAEQRARPIVDIEVIVGIDPGEALPDIGPTDVPVRFVAGNQRLQAAALNAAAADSRADYIAFIEDDDVWLPDHLLMALQMLAQHAGFVSGTQLEVDASGNVIRINDFPTPSGWVMPRATWETVGPFDETYRYHLDNDWLGRLANACIDRIHLVEATAPIEVPALEVRPWLMNIAVAGGGRVRFARHTLPVPLVTRLVHGASGVHAIKNDPSVTVKSRAEIARLEAAYGRIPW
jgi:glycosyltransferase involved in cell wall biosynthesis